MHRPGISISFIYTRPFWNDILNNALFFSQTQEKKKKSQLFVIKIHKKDRPISEIKASARNIDIWMNLKCVQFQ